MKKLLEVPITKTLTPLILLFSLVILLTVVIITVRERARQERENAVRNKRIQMVAVSPGKGNGDLGETKNLVPDLERGISLALLDIQNRNFREAEGKFNLLLEYYPKDMRLYAFLGNLYFIEKKFRNAEKVFQTQLEHFPQGDLFPVYHNIAASQARQHNFSGAIENVKRMLELRPDSGMAYFNLAGLYAVTGDLNAAMEAFSSAANLLDVRILPLSADPSLDPIRKMDAFMVTLELLRQKVQTPKASAPPENGAIPVPPEVRP